MRDAEPEDLMLLDDILGVLDPDISLAAMDPDARTRRLTALLNAAAIARTTPAVFVIEDAHWIDQTSEAMFADFAAVVPQTHVLILVTYRPEYRGALDQSPSSHRIPLTPLRDSDATTLVTELLGSGPAVTPFVAQVAERAAGNPLFAEAIVRDFAERGVVAGESRSLCFPARCRECAGARIVAVRYRDRRGDAMTAAARADTKSRDQDVGNAIPRLLAASQRSGSALSTMTGRGGGCLSCRLAAR